MVKIGWAPAHSARKVTEPADKNLGCVAALKSCATDAQVGPRGIRIERLQALIVVYRLVIPANTNGIGEARCKDVRLLYRKELPRGQCVELNVIQSVRRRVRGFVEHVRTEQTVIAGEPVIDARRKEVLADDLLPRERVFSGVPVAQDWSIGQMIESKVSLCVQIHAIRIGVRP